MNEKLARLYALITVQRYRSYSPNRVIQRAWIWWTNVKGEPWNCEGRKERAVCRSREFLCKYQLEVMVMRGRGKLQVTLRLNLDKWVSEMQFNVDRTLVI